MDHDVLVKVAEECFVRKPIWTEEGIDIDRRKTRDTSISQYTGGLVKVYTNFNITEPCHENSSLLLMTSVNLNGSVA